MSGELRVVSNKNGFTLLELIIVISIMGVIASVAYPSFIIIKRDRALYSQAREIAVDFRYMQQLAINGQANYSVIFNAGGGGYSIISGTSNVKTVVMENGIYYDPSASTGMVNDTYTVNTDGYPADSQPGGIIIALRNSSGKYIYVYIGIAGKVEIKWQ